MKHAVCLLSGGIDSTVTAKIAKSRGYKISALSFDYGQRNRRELESAEKISTWLNSDHKIFEIDLGQIGGSALTDEIEIPATKTPQEIKSSNKIPATYVPARNTIFLSIALAYAEVIDANAIFIGANSIDYSGYPDCRPKYFKRFQELADTATKKGLEGRGVEIKTPLLYLTKADIIKKGVELKVPFQYTWSCYRGGEKACGRCDSCVLRLDGFKEAGSKDPIGYE